MISVTQALEACLALTTPLDSEEIALQDGLGRVLAAPITATRNQPPFAASAMDGYALKASQASAGAQFRVVGEAPAGHMWTGVLQDGEALRIFTGAPLPEGADRIIIQEDITREGDVITLKDGFDEGPHIRAAGNDFRIGDRLEAPRRLRPQDLALAASMNAPRLQVTRKPEVALIATGDELVMPGSSPAPDQIIASNTFGLKAMIEAEGGHARLLPIARDTRESLETVFDLASSADLIVTIGGASVGDHDLVGQVAQDMGLERAFYKIAMRPGKPLMAGRLGKSAMLGLPGNPVSAMVCGHLFLVPMLHGFLGLPAAAPQRFQARLAVDLPPNGPREHYMRATLEHHSHPLPQITPFTRQDSALLSVFSQAGALMIRPPHQEALKAGSMVDYLTL